MPSRQVPRKETQEQWEKTHQETSSHKDKEEEEKPKATPKEEEKMISFLQPDPALSHRNWLPQELSTFEIATGHFEHSEVNVFLNSCGL